jgi:hypothetical protein
MQSLSKLLSTNGTINYKDFLNFSIPWTTGSTGEDIKANSTSYNNTLANEISRLREENIALKRELAVFDMVKEPCTYSYLIVDYALNVASYLLSII